MIPQLIAASAKLKIGLKKMKWSPPMNGIHAGQFVSINREIEHIDHFTVEQRSVSAAFGHKGCQLRIGAFIKQHSVEYAVDDIAQRTRQDERDTDNKPCFHSMLYELVQEPAYHSYRNDSK